MTQDECQAASGWALTADVWSDEESGGKGAGGCVSSQRWPHCLSIT